MPRCSLSIAKIYIICKINMIQVIKIQHWTLKTNNSKIENSTLPSATIQHSTLNIQHCASRITFPTSSNSSTAMLWTCGGAILCIQEDASNGCATNGGTWMWGWWLSLIYNHIHPKTLSPFSKHNAPLSRKEPIVLRRDSTLAYVISVVYYKDIGKEVRLCVRSVHVRHTYRSYLHA